MKDLIWDLLHFIISLVPLSLYILYLTRKTINGYVSIIFFLNVLYLFILFFSIYFIFLIFFSLFFFFNIWRYSKFFKKLGHSVYFKKLSIYFSFWQYINIYIYKSIYNAILYIYLYIYNIIYNIYNVFFLKIIINYNLVFFEIKKPFNALLTGYNYIVIYKKTFFNLKFIEFFYFFYNLIPFLKKKDLNYKFVDDPFIFRNKYIKLYTNINTIINKIIHMNFFIKNKNILFLFLFFILDKYIKVLFFKLSNIKFLLIFLKNIYNNFIKTRLYLLKKNINLLFIYLYFLLLNIIYNIIRFSIYILFYLFLFIKNIINRYTNIIVYLIILLLFFYFHWIITYFLLSLYKHYALYLPLFELKEHLRFLNFEWIDMRNYFNITKLHNVLIDLNIHNNYFYNQVIKQLNIKLNNCNFKFSSNLNVNIFLEKTVTTKETILLNNIFEKWNKYHGANFIRRWRKYKRMLNWSLRHTFKGKDWYRAIKKEKLNNSNLPIFNSGRYFENTKTEISNNLGFWENLHQVKNLPYTKDIKTQFQKKQAWYMYFKKRHAGRKKPRFLISYYIKLKYIPFSKIYKEFNTFFLDNYKIRKIKEINWGFEKYLNKLKYFEKISYFFKNIFINLKLYKYKKTNDRIFFFKKYYRNFISTQKDLIWKNKMPSLLITEQRLQRVPPITNDDMYYNDHISMAHTDEMHQFVYYKDLSKKGCLKNVFLKTRYLDRKYPYKINKKKAFYQYIIKNHFNLIETGIRIPKKFFFFERNKLRTFNKLSHRLLSKIDTVYVNQLLKYKYWDKVFFLNRLNNKKLDFWGFFDYLKINKYETLKKNDNFTLIFLDRWKKDYYHMRIYLLRIISFLHYYTLYRKVSMDNKPTGLDTLSAFNSFKFLNKGENVEKDIMQTEQEDDQLNEVVFYNFKLRWHFRELLNPSGIESYGHKDKFMYIINLFYKKFNKYFIEYNKINKYNNKYKFKVKSYKIKVLRKIRNLKSFFFYNAKRNKGWRLFSYINTFSIKFHLKHLLWHSPYSNLLFKENNICNNINIKKNFFDSYYYKKTKYDTISYSYIFNVLLNILDIRENWAYYLTDNTDFNINYNLLNSTFYYCYNYGNFSFFYLNELDIYRIFIVLLKNYYNNFLIKLTRYRYILDQKDYTVMYFFKNYLNHLYDSIYLKMRYFIYQTHETYVRYMKRKYLYFLRKKYWIRNRVNFMPFWFIFDYYIKSFIKYLFNKYYIKEHFIYWWLNYRLNYSFFYIFWLNIQKYQYIYRIKVNNSFYWILINKIYYYIYNLLCNNFYLSNDKMIVIVWYLNLIINNFIMSIYINYNIDMLKLLYKLIFFNYFTFIKMNMIYIFNIVIDFKYLLFFKFNIEDFFNFFMKYMQNIKNKFLYFKSNYYFFKKQKLLRRRKRHVPLYSFLSTNLKRNWFSLRNRSSNFFVFHNLYLFNLKIIFFKKDDINIYNFFSILNSIIPFIKKNIYKSNSFFFIYFIYILFFFIILFINKQFFKLFFINKKYENLSFELELKKKKNENVFNNIRNFKKKNIYYYKFVLFKLKSWKNLNVINIFYNKKYSLLRKLLDYKKYLNNTSLDQYDKNKPIFKSLISFVKFTNINRINKFIKNYTTFFFINKFPFKKIENDFFMLYEFELKKKEITLKYQKFDDYIIFNFIFFYWIFIIPYFFLQYILTKYHLKLYVRTRRRIYYFLRTYLDNIRLFVKINKYLGKSFFNTIYKSKRWKDPTHVFFNRKRAKKSHFSTYYLRYRNLYYRLSPIGSYYFWFSKINIVQYLLSYRNFFFKSIIKSYYYFWLILIYIIIYICIIKKILKSHFIKNFKYIKIFNKKKVVKS